MRNFATLMLLMLAFGSASAQVFTQNTMYRFSPFVYNPATAGVQTFEGAEFEGLNLSFLGRLQWVNIDGGPQLSTISAHSPSESLGGGIGGYLIRDQLGPWSTTGLNLAYSYKLKLGADERNNIRIGVNGGFLQKSINGEFIYDGCNDPLIPCGQYNAATIVPSLGAGIFFQGLDGKLFVGLSGQDLLEPDVEPLFATTGIGDDSRVARSFYFTAGYKIQLGAEGDEHWLEPTVFARTEGTLTPQLDATLYWHYKPLVVGGSYRFHNDSFSGILGFKALDRMFIGYAFDYTLGPLNANGDVGSHEIIISYTIPGTGGKGRQLKNVTDDKSIGL